MQKKWLVVLTLFFSTHTLASLDILGNYYFETVGNSREIPAGVVTSLTQDRFGFLWIGTQDGLIRYDGYSFVRYEHSKDDPNSLSDNFIFFLWSDKEGRVWAGTSDKGLSVYDPSNNSFFNFSHNDQDSGSLSDNTVKSIYPDKNGGVWIGTRKGLNYLQPHMIEKPFNQWKFVRSTIVDGDSKANLINGLFVAEDETLWVATHKGAYIKKINGNVFTRPFLRGMSEDLVKSEVFTIAGDKNQGIWLGTAAHGAFRVDSSGNLIHLSPDRSKKNHLKSPFVSSIISVNDHEIWLSSFGGGIAIFDLTVSKITKYIQHKQAISKSLNLNDVRILFKDRSGLVWVGTWGGGLNRFNPQTVAFTRLLQDVNDPKSISSSYINDILELKDGTLWLATDNNGIDFIDPNRGLIGGLRAGNKSGLEDNSIHKLVQGDDNNIWIGTFQKGVYRYRIKDKKLTQFSLKEGLRHATIRGLAADEKSVWVGTNLGLDKIDIATGKIEALYSIENRGSPLKISMNVVLRQRNGTVWAASKNKLFVVHPNKNMLIPVNLKFPDGKAIEMIKGILSKDDSDRIWIPTQKGLSHLISLNGADAVFQNVNIDLKSSGVSDEFQLSNEFQFGPRNRLWNNQFLVDLKSKFVTKFTEADGVDVGTVFQNSSLKTSDNLILYGGTSGLLVINPSKYRHWNYQPNVVISGLKIDNKPVHLNDQLTLEPGTSSFEVEFSALDFSAPDLINYAYKLEGYDKEWTFLDSKHRVAKYTNLDPGQFTLHVKGSNRLREWSQQKLELRIEKLASWYQTIWFKLCLGFVFMLFIYILFEYRTRVLKKRAEELEQKVNEKTRDIRSILGAIQQGILAIESPEGCVGPEHSEYLNQLTGCDDISGKNFYDLLFDKNTFSENEKSQIMSAINSSIEEDVMGFEMNSHLLPREAIVQKDNTQHIFELDWNPITHDDIVLKILLVVRDVTDLRELERKSKKHREEIKIIQEIINVPGDKFYTLLKSCYQFIEDSRNIIDKFSDFNLGAIQQLFRNMHTMKGLARSYSLGALAESAHVAEQIYNNQLNSKSWDTEAQLEELNKVEMVLKNYNRINSEKLDRKDRDSQVVSVDIETLEANIIYLTTEDISTASDTRKRTHDELKKLFIDLVTTPFEQVIGDQLKSVSSLARQLKKEVPKIIIEDAGFSINRNAHELLNNVFTHLIRNSMDHGIEDPQERISKGKNSQGELAFTLTEKNSQLEIRFHDDGRGLNVERIYHSALDKGLISSTDSREPEFLANLLFMSGFSTAERISDISGRGVGLDAVKSFLEENNCSIEIQVKQKSEFIGFFPIEFVITMPTPFFEFYT